jgi:23S rRNA pseudouridine955/2504/2580 synthase
MNYTINYTTPIRLDRFLKQQYQLITQGIIQKALRNGEVRVNNTKAKEASTRLLQGDVLQVTSFFDQYKEIPQTRHVNDSVKSLSQKILHDYLLFRNEDFIVINKPAKIASQGGSHVSLSIDEALKYLNSASSDEYKLVHRLDKETSGVMLIARNYEPAVRLTGAFRDKKIYKTYLAVATGRLQNEQGTVEVDGEITHYKLLQYFPAKNISHIEFRPVTGKEHQIRRHAIALGVEIVGDKKYGQEDSKEGFMLLHSSSCRVDEIIFGQSFEFSAPLPGYFEKFLV